MIEKLPNALCDVKTVVPHGQRSVSVCVPDPNAEDCDVEMEMPASGTLARTSNAYWIDWVCTLQTIFNNKNSRVNAVLLVDVCSNGKLVALGVTHLKCKQAQTLDGRRQPTLYGVIGYTTLFQNVIRVQYKSYEKLPNAIDCDYWFDKDLRLAVDALMVGCGYTEDGLVFVSASKCFKINTIKVINKSFNTQKILLVLELKCISSLPQSRDQYVLYSS